MLNLNSEKCEVRSEKMGDEVVTSFTPVQADSELDIVNVVAGSFHNGIITAAGEVCVIVYMKIENRK